MRSSSSEAETTDGAGNDQAPGAYNIDGAIGYTGLTRSRIYELVGAGVLDARKAGRRTLIVGDSLRAYLAGLPRADIRVGRKAT